MPIELMAVSEETAPEGLPHFVVALSEVTNCGGLTEMPFTGLLPI